MKTSPITFTQLRRLLADLQFTEARSDSYWRFEHPDSGTIFVFRPYSMADRVTVQDVAATRKHLDWRGLLPGTVFDDALTKTPA
jgi:hypothetical protein